MKTERLVWMRESELQKICRAVNLASMMGDQARNDDFIPIDFDGIPVMGEALEEGLQAIEDAHDALMKIRYVPEGLETMRHLLEYED